MKNSIGFDPTETAVCAECGATAVTETMENEEFSYGSGKEKVVLHACVPVLQCKSCGLRFTDARADDLRHEAVCRYVGRMTPAEIRQIRERHKYSQEDWATLTGFGVASIKRWETGALIQNEAADRYLRLLGDQEVLAKLSKLINPPPPARVQFKFQTMVLEESRQRAARFRLLITYPLGMGTG